MKCSAGCAVSDIYVTKAAQERAQREAEKEAFIECVAQYAKEQGFEGTAQELGKRVNSNLAATTIGRWLYRNREYLSKQGVSYSFYRTNGKRMIVLKAKNDA